VKKFNLLIFIFYIFNVNIFSQNFIVNNYSPGEGLTFTNDNGAKFTMRGYIQPYFDLKVYSDTIGDDFWTRKISKPQFRVRMRRVRVRMFGNTANEKIHFRLQTELTGSPEVEGSIGTMLMDAFVSYKATKYFKITFGQRAPQTDHRSMFMLSNTLQFTERSRLASFAVIREFGLFLEHRIKVAPQKYIRPYLIVSSGDGFMSLARNYGGLKYGGRIDFVPFGLFTRMGQFRQADIVRENSPKLVFGGYYSYNDGISSRRGRVGGDIVFLNSDQEESLPDYQKYGVDFLFKYKGFSMLGEYLNTKANIPSDIAYYIRNNGTLSTTVTEGEFNYPLNKMMLGSAYNIQMGYIFKNLFSIDARYTHFKPDEYSFLNNGTFYSRPNYYTLGFTKYLDNNYSLKIQGSITYVDLAEGANSNVATGDPSAPWYQTQSSGHEMIYRLITTFSF
tara:strand:- start:740 stop:2080 length:1341 start_codon:yes stop_codon:yes gene_type:complete